MIMIKEVLLNPIAITAYTVYLISFVYVKVMFIQNNVTKSFFWQYFKKTIPPIFLGAILFTVYLTIAAEDDITGAKILVCQFIFITVLSFPGLYYLFLAVCILCEKETFVVDDELESMVKEISQLNAENRQEIRYRVSELCLRQSMREGIMNVRKD